MLNVNTLENKKKSHAWLEKIFDNTLNIDTNWLGNGNTSELIIKELKKFLK